MQQKMKFQLSLLALTMAAACQSSAVFANGLVASEFEVKADISKLQAPAASQQVATYIVQLAGKSGVEKAAELGQLKASPIASAKNLYNASHPSIVAYNGSLKKVQEQLAAKYATGGLIYSYTHTFNGFSARMTEAQAEQLKMQAGVIGVWQDKAEQVQTSRTPALLGLTGPNGQHTLGLKGEDMIVGIVDTGIAPDHPSFADTGDYEPLARFKGTCDIGTDADFACNDKLIGARYFKGAFETVYEIRPEEFISPRDADNHGSHVASTAAGNEGIDAVIGESSRGKITGMAPRARVAVYKACWNSDYVSPEGEKERGCFYGDTMAAIDAAVADGVDVINYSIGGDRVDLTTVSTAAMLRATQAGVLVAVAAGNDGENDTKGTVGTPAPWVVSVAASGFSIDALKVNAGLANNQLSAVEGSVAKPLDVTGAVTADIGVAEPLAGCTALTNPAAVAGKIVLIQRGGCTFAEKLQQAQDAGAAGMLVYNNVADGKPGMGGQLAGANIPALGITLADGTAIKAAVDGGTTVNVTFDPTLVANAMADFSSKGPNLSTGDVLKPDVTAPGVNILAAGTPTTFTSPAGNNFTYLSGTSMASPHIAGLATLLRQQHPSWTPAMVKSALMTTAHQNVSKASSSVLADPFDFGAGHVRPVDAANPGLVYDAAAEDYFAFLCGLGKTNFVLAESGFSCAQYEQAGYPTDASQLNQPAIAVSSLKAAKTIVRVVKDVTGTASTYVPTINAPAGVAVEFKKVVDGKLVSASSLDVPANGQAIYAVTLTPTTTAIFDTYVFGSLTLSDGQHSVRSPIAVKPVSPDTIKAQAVVSAEVAAASGRVSFTADYSYSGATAGKLYGLTRPAGSNRTVSQDADGAFAFNEAGLGTHIMTVPAGTQVARFSLRNGLFNVVNPNVDLYVYRCVKWRCSLVTSSQNAEANEDIVLNNPAPANDSAAGDVYVVWTHGRDLKGAASANYTLVSWIVNAPVSSTASLLASTRAVNGRPNVVTVTTKNLVKGSLPYMGVVTLSDNTNAVKTSTVLEVFAK